MNSSRLEWKVGLFVLIGLVLLATLMASLSKGLAAFAPSYELRLRTANVGGIKRNASVQMAGVAVGSAQKAELSEDGKSVLLHLRILSRYHIRSDARFTIEQAGFLGDQFVSVTPQGNEAPYLKHGAEVQGLEPFKLQEAARTALGLVERVDQTVANLNLAIQRVDRTLLAEETLTNLTTTVANFRQVSERTLTTVDNFRTLSDDSKATIQGINGLVASNSPAISQSISNLVTFTGQLHSISNLAVFSERLNRIATDLHDTVLANRQDIQASVKNIEASSELAKQLLSDLQAGKGLAGTLLKDDELSRQLGVLLTNLTTLSSNLNRFGLLYKPKPVKTSPASKPPLRQGRGPFRD